MLTQIAGARPAEDLISLLLECHGRIRSFTDLAARLAEGGGAAPAEVAEAAERVRRYFTEALPLHARDEEESILPRLAGRDRQLDAALVAMHHEHAEHEPALERLVVLCAQLAAAPERHAELAPALASVAAALREMFDRHLAREESTVFPAVERYVDDEGRRQIVRELRARRQVSVSE